MNEIEPRAVAVLGTGPGAAAVARGLARAGHDVRAWVPDDPADPADPAGTAGADGVVVVDSPAAAVHDAEIVLTMLRDATAVLEVMTAASPGLRAGTAWLQSTTVPFDLVADLGTFAREHGLVLVDAPVLGGPDGDRTVLAAGPPQVRGFVGPVLDAVAARTVWTGDDAEAGSATLRALEER